jgi:hypothetical protein
MPFTQFKASYQPDQLANLTEAFNLVGLKSCLPIARQQTTNSPGCGSS